MKKKWKINKEKLRFSKMWWHNEELYFYIKHTVRKQSVKCRIESEYLHNKNSFHIYVNDIFYGYNDFSDYISYKTLQIMIEDEMKRQDISLHPPKYTQYYYDNLSWINDYDIYDEYGLAFNEYLF